MESKAKPKRKPRKKSEESQPPIIEDAFKKLHTYLLSVPDNSYVSIDDAFKVIRHVSNEFNRGEAASLLRRFYTEGITHNGEPVRNLVRARQGRYQVQTLKPGNTPPQGFQTALDFKAIMTLTVVAVVDAENLVVKDGEGQLFEAKLRRVRLVPDE